ncbi:MAG: hypothetical protein FJX60_13570 [Alphaproteobacteria bacterium]|nr:hypothetical protein [Alphaproteobacteria bacterium]
MPDRDPLPYRTDKGVALIELRLQTLDQLFNVFDPSPFHRKDLDQDAENYIVGALRELGPRPARLVLHLPKEVAAAENARGVGAAIRNYFAFQAQITARDLRLELRRGRDSLAIGLLFLGGCQLLRQLVLSFGEGPMQTVLAEGFLIAGWVALWRPIEIYLYEWWPYRRRLQVYRRLAEIEVEIEASEGASPLSPISAEGQL